MEIAIVVVVVVALALIQVRRRGSRLQRPDDPRAHLRGDGAPERATDDR